MSGLYDQPSNYKCEGSEFISINSIDDSYDIVSGEFILPLKYNKAVDKIRISAAYAITHNNIIALPCFIIHSTIIDKPLITVGAYYAGSIGGGDHYYAKDLNTSKGQEIIFYNKIIPNGEYRCNLTQINGVVPTIVGSVVLYFYVEYFKNY
jgi:hypothetical protein